MNKEVVTIYRGEDRTLLLRVADESGRPVDLGAPTDVKVIFKSQDGTDLIKSLSDGVTEVSYLRGEIQVDLNTVETAVLKTGNSQDVCMEYVNANKKRKVKFYRSLTVV